MSTVTFVRALAAALIAAADAEEGTPEKDATPEKKPAPRGRPVKGEAAPAPTQPTETATTATAPAASTVSPVAVATVSFKDAADALVALAEGVSRDAAVALLGKFGAGKAPELKPADYAAFVTEAKAQLEAAKAPKSGASGLV